MDNPEYTSRRDVICWVHGLMLGVSIGVPVGLVLSWIF